MKGYGCKDVDAYQGRRWFPIDGDGCHGRGMIANRLMVAKGGRSLSWEGDGCQEKLVVA